VRRVNKTEVASLARNLNMNINSISTSLNGIYTTRRLLFPRTNLLYITSLDLSPRIDWTGLDLTRLGD
jgi:hypothetical protein